MSFKQNLKRKIEIDRLTRRVLDSLKPTENGTRIDKEAMGKLLQAAGYESRVERDTQLFSRDFNASPPEIIVLDAGLPLYRTDLQDVLLRKNPTTREMISIRNAIRILNDKDVVRSRKADTVMQVHGQCMQQLDLQYNQADIASLSDLGARGLESGDPEAVVEALELFAELLDLGRLRTSMQSPQIRMWAKRLPDRKQEGALGDPLILFLSSENRLQLFHSALSAAGRSAAKTVEAILTQRTGPDLEGREVFQWMAAEVLENPPAHKPIDSLTP